MTKVILDTSPVGQIKTYVNLLSTLFQVVCGQDHTLFLTEDGRVYACGLGSDGQTGIGFDNSCVQYSVYSDSASPVLLKLLF